MSLHREHLLVIKSLTCSVQSLSHLFDLVSLLLGAECGGGDAQALLEHGHARLGLAALDLGQATSLLRLSVLHVLYQTLVVAMHLFHLLQQHSGGSHTFLAQDPKEKPNRKYKRMHV